MARAHLAWHGFPLAACELQALAFGVCLCAHLSAVAKNATMGKGDGVPARGYDICSLLAAAGGRSCVARQRLTHHREMCRLKIISVAPMSGRRREGFQSKEIDVRGIRFVCSALAGLVKGAACGRTASVGLLPFPGVSVCPCGPPCSQPWRALPVCCDTDAAFHPRSGGFSMR